MHGELLTKLQLRPSHPTVASDAGATSTVRYAMIIDWAARDISIGPPINALLLPYQWPI